MRKFIFFILLLGLSAGISYYHSNKIYNFYLKIYYIDILKYNENDFIKKMELLKSKDHKHDLLFLINIALNLYPGNRNIIQMAGHYYFDNGFKNKGCMLLLRSLNKSQNDYVIFQKIMEFIFENKMYKVIVTRLANYNLDNYASLQFYYGASLFNLNRFNDAELNLAAAYKNNYQDAELYYYLALVNYKNQKQNDAVFFAKKAYYAAGNKRAANLLIKLYSETKQYEKAGKIIQKAVKK